MKHWTEFLPEVGQPMLEYAVKIKALRAEIDRCRAQIRTLEDEAEASALEDWTGPEIIEAQDKARGGLAMTSSTQMLALFDKYAKARTLEAKGLQRFTRHGEHAKGRQGLKQAERYAVRAEQLAIALIALMRDCDA